MLALSCIGETLVVENKSQVIHAHVVYSLSCNHGMKWAEKNNKALCVWNVLIRPTTMKTTKGIMDTFIKKNNQKTLFIIIFHFFYFSIALRCS